MIKFVWIPLLGTNISFSQGMFEDDFPFPKVGYVNFLEGIQFFTFRYLNLLKLPSGKSDLPTAAVTTRRGARRVSSGWPGCKPASLRCDLIPRYIANPGVLLGSQSWGKLLETMMCKKVLMIGSFWSYKKDYNIKIQYITSEVVSHTSPSRWKRIKRWAKMGVLRLRKVCPFRVCVPTFRAFGVDRNFAIGTWLQKPISTTIGSNPPCRKWKVNQI